jgi:hypothetical protein
MDWCAFCGEPDVELEITLDDGKIIYAHIECAPGAIIENASTDNPVHEIEEIVKKK